MQIVETVGWKWAENTYLELFEWTRLVLCSEQWLIGGTAQSDLWPLHQQGISLHTTAHHWMFPLVWDQLVVIWWKSNSEGQFTPKAPLKEGEVWQTWIQWIFIIKYNVLDFVLLCAVFYSERSAWYEFSCHKKADFTLNLKMLVPASSVDVQHDLLVWIGFRVTSVHSVSCLDPPASRHHNTTEAV